MPVPEIRPSTIGAI